MILPQPEMGMGARTLEGSFWQGPGAMMAAKAAAQTLVSPSWSQGNLMITVDN